MPNTVPNQKVVHVNRQKCEKNFLQISKENWYAANKALSPYGLQLYLYIAGNRDGFDFALLTFQNHVTTVIDCDDFFLDFLMRFFVSFFFWKMKSFLVSS